MWMIYYSPDVFLDPNFTHYKRSPKLTIHKSSAIKLNVSILIKKSLIYIQIISKHTWHTHHQTFLRRDKSAEVRPVQLCVDRRGNDWQMDCLPHRHLVGWSGNEWLFPTFAVLLWSWRSRMQRCKWNARGVIACCVKWWKPPTPPPTHNPAFCFDWLQACCMMLLMSMDYCLTTCFRFLFYFLRRHDWGILYMRVCASLLQDIDVVLRWWQWWRMRRGYSPPTSLIISFTVILSPQDSPERLILWQPSTFAS